MSKKYVKLTSHPQKSKVVNTYETRSILATVVLDPETNKKRLSPDHPIYYNHEISHFKVGDTVTLNITSKKPKRSQQQNRYMHQYFTLIAISHGHGVTPEEVKSWAKGKCLSSGITEIFGDKVRKVKETSKLTVLEMVEFLARVECESGIPMPDPTPFQFSPPIDEWNRRKQEEIIRYMGMKSLVKI